ncbi:hypothetical protein JCM8547_001214 [Rhodosporidiobolus lusitaniae]
MLSRPTGAFRLPLATFSESARFAARPAAFSPSTSLVARSFASTAQGGLPRGFRGSKTAEKEIKGQAGGKVQTIPFQITPERGVHISTTAAHSAFGVGYVLRLLLARFFHRFFGVSLDSGFFHTGVKRVAFKPVLLPIWKLDLAVKGKALLDQAEMQLNISALNASLPGFRLDPLDRLTVNPPFEVEPIPFSASEHLDPFSQLDPSPSFPSGQPSVSLIPFTRTPLNLLSKLTSFPRGLSSEGLSVDPKKFEPVLFAAYPTLIPVYLGEFELEEMEAGDESPKRVTTATFATVDGTAFSVYPQFLSPPVWLPQSSTVDLSIAGRPSDPSDLPSPEALKSLKPRIEEALEDLKRLGARVDGEALDPASVTEVIKFGEGEGIEEYLQKEGRAMGYAEWADLNREYVEAVFELDTAEAILKQIEGLPEEVRTVIVSPTSIPKISSQADLLADAKRKLKQAQEKVAALKPEWIDEIEKREREKKESERKKRVEERGLRGRGRA